MYLGAVHAMMSRVCAAVMMLLLSGGAAAQNDSDIIFKINEEGYFQRIKLEPGACDESHQYCIEVPKVVEGETVKSLTEKFRTRYSHFSEGWIEYISDDIGKKFDAYMKAKEMGIIAIGNSFTTSAFSFGIVVDNFYGLDYLTNKFKVDMKIYIREIEETTNKTLEEVKNEAYTNKTAVVEYQGKDGEKYIELLSKPWEEVNSLPRYKNAVPVRNTFCSDKYHEKMRVISEAKYKEKFGGEGVQIQHSTAAPSVILDSDKNILYLKANGVQITFDAPNGRFFPLQSNILDIKLYLPRSREFDRAVICIDPHFTGFHLPMESASRIRTNVPFLSMVPRITGERAPPYLGTHHSQMRNKYLEDDPEDQIEGAKMVESATFTLIYIPEYWGGFAMLLPFIFIIIATLLQWLVHNPDKFSNSQMITAILQLQSVVSAQKGYMQSDNKMTNVIFLTYGIIISNILTIALMAYINTCKEKGRSPTLVRLKESIFRMLRLFDILLALFLIPVLAVKTDNLTGEQVDYPFTWYIVGFTTFFLIAFRGFKEYRKYKKSIAHSMEEEASEKADEEELARMSSLSPDSTWTSEQVGQWIGNSELVRDSSALTEGELLGIASKFVEADVNGIVFPMVAYDADALKRDVNLTVGEAFLFVHTMQKLSAPPDEEKETTNAAFAEAVLVK